MKPKLLCPHCHKLIPEKEVRSHFGRLSQYSHLKKVGKEKYIKEKLKNLKKNV